MQFIGRRSRQPEDRKPGERVFLDHARADSYAFTVLANAEAGGADPRGGASSAAPPVAMLPAAPPSAPPAAALSAPPQPMTGHQKKKLARSREAVAALTKKAAKSLAVAKLAETRKIKDLVTKLSSQQEKTRQSLKELTDEERVLVAFGGYLDAGDVLSGESKAWRGECVAVPSEPYEDA